MVTMYSSVSGPVRVKRSMRCTFSLAQKMFVLAGISVLPAPDGPVIYPIAADRTETSFVAQSFSFRGRHLSPRLSSVSRSRVSVSNWLSGRHWQLNQAPAVGNPTGIAELGPSHRASTGDFNKTRWTTFLSMSIPNACEMIRAIRGHPNRGLRDLSSTIARMSASLGLFGPGFFGRWLDENKRRYLRRTSA